MSVSPSSRRRNGIPPIPGSVERLSVLFSLMMPPQMMVCPSRSDIAVSMICSLITGESMSETVFESASETVCASLIAIRPPRVTFGVIFRITPVS